MSKFIKKGDRNSTNCTCLSNTPLFPNSESAIFNVPFASSPAEKKEAALLKENLWQLLDANTLRRRANRSGWLEAYQRHLDALQVPRDMQSRAMLLQLWATQVRGQNCPYRNSGGITPCTPPSMSTSR